MQNKIPSLWKIAGLLIGVPLAWLVSWLVLTAIFHIPVASTTELAGLLSAIGGVMGAIFTVGGLVIALVAVLSQLTLEDRAKRVMEDKFNELVPALEERADHRIAGRIAYRDALQAMSEGKWDTAEILVKQTLDLYPDLLHVRSTFAHAMSTSIVIDFQYQLRNVSTHPLVRQIEIAHPLPAAPVAKAVEWLADARRTHDDPDGQVSADQALLYAYTGAYTEMIDAVRRALAINRAQRGYLLRPECLAMLVSACSSERARIQHLGEALQHTLPASDDDVIASVNAMVPTLSQNYVHWYAAEPRVLHPRSRMLATIRIYRIDGDDGHSRSYAYVFSANENASYTVPTKLPELFTPPSEENQLYSVSELVAKLSEQFHFICPTVPDLQP